MKIGLLGVCFLACVETFAQDDLSRLAEDAMPAVGDSINTAMGPSPGDEERTSSDKEARMNITAADTPFSLDAAYLQDPYLTQTGFAFSGLGFRPRGYNANQMAIYINGAWMNDIVSRNVYYGLWSGLNGVFKNRRQTRGLMPAAEGFGGMGGWMSLDIRAASRSRGNRLAYSSANYGTRNRLMLSYASGSLSNGWALAAAFSKRWTKEGYIPGAFYNAYTYYLGLSRKLGEKHSLHFSSFGSWGKQGLAQSATREAIELAGSHYYNPGWGYQAGRKRNARVANAFQPVFLLNYVWKPNTGTQLEVVASFQTGYSGRSGLGWYNVEDPRPDYYRNLPSYYLYNPDGADTQTADAIRKEWLNNPAKAQINWSRIYEVNNLNRDSVNGVYGKRSLYVLGADRDDSKKYSIDAHFQKKIGNWFTLRSGLNLTGQQTERYQKMLDLLGGDYFVDLNQFAERTYAGSNSLNQQDLNHPDRLVKKGDKYNYDYRVRLLRVQAFSQVSFTRNRFAFFLGATLEGNAFSREGLYKNGLFPDSSYGKSEVQRFLSYGGKAGLRYSLHPGHTLFINAAYGCPAPVFDAVFYAPRNRNATIANPENEQFSAAEGGYILHKKRSYARITVFATDLKDKTEVLRYYDESYRNFVNYAMQGIDIRHMGVEFSFQTKLLHRLSAGAAASWMQVFYSSRPDITVYPDNDTSAGAGKDKIYWKNYYRGSTPQSAYTFNLKYTPFRYGFISARINYLHRSYVSLNPVRHTENAVGMVPAGSDQWQDILEQEQLPAITTIDIQIGKSFNLKKLFKGTPNALFLHIDAGVNNVLNNQNIQVSGYQQLRFDYATRRPERFPDKYRYGYGRTYYLNLSLRF